MAVADTFSDRVLILRQVDFSSTGRCDVHKSEVPKKAAFSRSSDPSSCKQDGELLRSFCSVNDPFPGGQCCFCRKMAENCVHVALQIEKTSSGKNSRSDVPAAGRLSRPHDVSYARDTDTYIVADSYQDRVCTFTSEGAHLRSFPLGALFFRKKTKAAWAPAFT